MEDIDKHMSCVTQSITLLDSIIRNKYLAAGQIHSLSLAWAKEVKAWGNQANGRLGNGVTTGNAANPVASKYAANSNIADAIGIAVGTGHSVFLRWDPNLVGDARSTVWGFGFNSSGQLGNNATATNQPYAVQTIGVNLSVTRWFPMK